MKQRSPFYDSPAAAAAVLLLLTALCYWPMAFGVFSAKNDNIVQFLPVRYNISEALRSGHLPLWSPYIYLGYPVHGDMQGGAWNPLVWLISAFGRYNVTSLHVEILVYIFLSGLGMYRLLGTARVGRGLQLTGAAAYLMCGYITDVGGSNAPFLAAAAYVPFVLAFFYEVLTTGMLRPALCGAAALALLFVSGYPSFFITTCYILLAAWIVQAARRRPLRLKAMIVWAVAFLLLCAPAIISYAEVLPLYRRGSGVSLKGALQNAFHPSCTVSFLLPGVTPGVSPLYTDLISRNAYFNSFFLLFALCYVVARKRAYLTFALAGVLFFYFFSLGAHTPLRAWCYKLLPLMNTFRHPSNARLFVTVGGIVLGAAVCRQWLDDRLPKRAPLAALGLLMLLTLVVSAHWINPVSTWSQLARLGRTGNDWRHHLKDFFSALTLADLALINALAQLALLALLAWAVVRRRKRAVGLLFVVNSFLFAQLSLPYTFVSQVSPRTLNGLLRAYPSGHPAPPLDRTVGEASAHALDQFQLLGITAFYRKDIATTDVAFTPTFMTAFEELYRHPASLQTVLANPYAYPVAIATTDTTRAGRGVALLTEDSVPAWPMNSSFEATETWNNGFAFRTSSSAPLLVALTQLALPGWHCTIDGKETKTLRINTSFQGVLVPAGDHKVLFEYRPKGVVVAFCVALLTAIFIFTLAILLREKTLFR